MKQTKKKGRETDVLKNFFSSFKQKTSKDQALTTLQNDFVPPRLSEETEVAFIKKLLERKFNRSFQMRVKVEGYLGEELEYSLVIDDYCSCADHYKHHCIFGYRTKDILNVKRLFLNAYWDRIKEALNFNELKPDNWDRERIAGYKETMVAETREKLLLLAALEGL